LLLDAATVEVVRVLAADGIKSILLKGPVIARWLYRSGEQSRGYLDIDLLVSASQVQDAADTLRRHGFDYLLPSSIEQGATDHALVLVSPPEHSTSRAALGSRTVAVDLHRTLHGVSASPQEVWQAIHADAETMTILDAEISIPGEAARTLHVALHAGAQGAYTAQPLEDLRRALDVVDQEVWGAAAELAARLVAVPLFATGLSMDPRGRVLAERLGIDTIGDVDARLRAGAAPALSFGLTRLRSTRGIPARTKLLARELVPTPSFMRVWSSIARLGAAGLMLAYLYRPFWLAVKLPGAVVAVARASRGTEDARRH
jgi:hypothetical protein